MVRPFYRNSKILIAAFVSSPDIFLRNVMPASQNSIPNSSQINLDILGPDIDKYNLESALSGVHHHLQVILSRKRRFHRETIAIGQVLRSRLEHLPRPATGRNVDVLACKLLAIASGSSTGMSRKKEAFQRVSVVLPEPLAPAMKVSLGGFT